MKQPLPFQILELWTLAPQIVVNRLYRLSTASSVPSQTSLRELDEMWMEKLVATCSALQAVSMDSAKFQSKVFSAASRATNPVLWPQAFSQILFRYSPVAGLKMTESMITPFHSKVKSNARRLL